MNTRPRGELETRVAQTPCMCCDRAPTVHVRFYGQHGIIGSASPRLVDGPFCRDCGIATFRTATEWALASDWKSLSSLITTPVNALSNVGARHEVGRLGTPNGSATAPLPLGRPLLLRWRTSRALVPLVVLAALATLIVGAIQWLSDKPGPGVGSCVQTYGVQPLLFGGANLEIGRARFVFCSLPHDGTVTKVVDSGNDCPDFTGQLSDQSETYCVTWGTSPSSSGG